MNAWTMHKGDALAVLRDLPDASVDVILTDPPFSSGGRRENARSVRKSMIRGTEDDAWIAGDSMSTAGFIWTIRQFGMQARRILKPGGHLLSFIDWRMYPNLCLGLEVADLVQRSTIVWDKTYFGMGGQFRNQHEFVIHMTNGQPDAPQRRDVGNVIQCKPIRGGVHPTEKPVALLETLLSVVCPVGGVVVDPFAGSGATGVAALNYGADFIGVEMSDHYHGIAYDRLRTAQDAHESALLALREVIA